MVAMEYINKFPVGATFLSGGRRRILGKYGKLFQRFFKRALVTLLRAVEWRKTAETFTHRRVTFVKPINVICV